MSAALYRIHPDREPVQQPKLKGRPPRGVSSLARARRFHREAEARRERESRRAAISQEVRALRSEVHVLEALRSAALSDIERPASELAANARKRAREVVDDITNRLAACDARLTGLALELWR